MCSDKLYRAMAISYRKLISASNACVPHHSLRNYCRLHHVNYADFVLWALLSKTACVLPEIFSKETGSSGSTSSFSPRRESVPLEQAPQDTLLYPVKFTSPVEMSDAAESSLQNPSGLLSGVHIRFSDGTTVYIQQASAQEITHVINTCKP